MTHRVRSRCRAEGCRSKAVMIALVDEHEPRPGEQKTRYGVCLCRAHGLMWLKHRFEKFRLKPHRPPEASTEGASAPVSLQTTEEPMCPSDASTPDAPS